MISQYQYQSGFLPTIWSLDLNGTFVEWEWGVVYSLLCYVGLALPRLPFRPHWTVVKPEETRSLMGPYIPHFLLLNLHSLYSSHMNLSLPHYYRFVGSTFLSDTRQHHSKSPFSPLHLKTIQYDKRKLVQTCDSLKFEPILYRLLPPSPLLLPLPPLPYLLSLIYILGIIHK